MALAEAVAADAARGTELAELGVGLVALLDVVVVVDVDDDDGDDGACWSTDGQCPLLHHPLVGKNQLRWDLVAAERDVLVGADAAAASCRSCRRRSRSHTAARLDRHRAWRLVERTDGNCDEISARGSSNEDVHRMTRPLVAVAAFLDRRDERCVIRRIRCTSNRTAVDVRQPEGDAASASMLVLDEAFC